MIFTIMIISNRKMVYREEKDGGSSVKKCHKDL